MRPKIYRRFGTLVSLIFVASIGLALPAQAATVNPNPINWGIYTTLYGPGMRDVPMRYGQHDAGPIDGFGTRHIEDDHEKWGTWTDTANKFEEVINTGSCSTSGTSVTCTKGTAYRFVAVYSTRVDSRTPDRRPVGVITFYWFCNTCLV